MQSYILHLSDIHLTEDSNPIFNKCTQLCNAILSELPNKSNLYIVFTGDIAYSGLKIEYDKANELIDNIKKNLMIEKDLAISIITIPGNHDCAFPKEKLVLRDLCIEKMLTNNNEVLP